MLILPRSVRPGAVSLVLAAIMSWMFTCTTPAAAQDPLLSAYTTNFPLTEIAISERGRWINGGAVGLDWSNVQTTSKTLAWGTQVFEGHTNDSIALMTGTWEPDLTVQAVLRAETPAFAGKVELILRGTLSAHNAKFYQFTCSAESTEIVKWNGELDNVTLLARNASAHCGNGDTFKASAIGSTLKSYINGVQVNNVTDTDYSSGSPGIGFFVDNTGTNQANGFSSFTVTGGPTSSGPPPAPPGSLTVIVTH